MTQEKLRENISKGALHSVYLLYGDEPYLARLYTTRIADKVLAATPPDERACNLVKLRGDSPMQTIADSVRNLPLFADCRVVVLNDCDIDKLAAAQLDELLAIIESAGEPVTLILRMARVTLDPKKANTKKLLACMEKLEKSGRGAVVRFEKLSEQTVADTLVKRAEKSGCTLSKDNAAYLSRCCLKNLELLENEVDKLCAYCGYSGDIPRKAIDLLTARQLEPDVFKLAGEITAKRAAGALTLLDNLIVQQNNPPIKILAALINAFADFYRAKLGSNAGKPPPQIAKDFGYPPNRAWVIGKIMPSVSRMSLSTLRRCLQVLADADYKLKSSPLSDRIIMERAIAELLLIC